jgi:type II secretory pathway component PulJ
MKKGISLVELLVSLVISALLLISMLKVFGIVNSFVFRISKEVRDSLAIFRTLDMLERDLKLATGNFSCSTDFVSFDALVDGKIRRIRYYVSKQKIMRR